MVETCELTSAGMGWAEVEAPSAYQAAEVVEMVRPQRRAMKDRNSAAVAAANRVWMVIQTGPVVVQAVAANLTTMAATVVGFVVPASSLEGSSEGLVCLMARLQGYFGSAAQHWR